MGVFVVSQRERVDVSLFPGLLCPAAQGNVAFYGSGLAGGGTGSFLVHAELGLHSQDFAGVAVHVGVCWVCGSGLSGSGSSVHRLSIRSLSGLIARHLIMNHPIIHHLISHYATSTATRITHTTLSRTIITKPGRSHQSFSPPSTALATSKRLPGRLHLPHYNTIRTGPRRLICTLPGIRPIQFLPCSSNNSDSI